MNKMTLVFAFQFLFLFGYSQNDLLLIAPDNVDIHLTEQFAYYVGFYTILRDDLEVQKVTCEGEIERILSKERINRADKRQLKELENQLPILKHKIFLIGECIKKWAEYPFENEKNHVVYDDVYCFDLISNEKVYSHKEYLLYKIGPSDFVSWNEVLDIEIIETETGVTTKWEKRERLNAKGEIDIIFLLPCRNT